MTYIVVFVQSDGSPAGLSARNADGSAWVRWMVPGLWHSGRWPVITTFEDKRAATTFGRNVCKAINRMEIFDYACGYRVRPVAEE